MFKGWRYTQIFPTTAFWQWCKHSHNKDINSNNRFSITGCVNPKFNFYLGLDPQRKYKIQGFGEIYVGPYWWCTDYSKGKQIKGRELACDF